LEIKN